MTISFKIGDCAELILDEDTKIDAVVTDPPYAISIKHGGGIAAQRALWGGGDLNNIHAGSDFDVIAYLELFRERINPFVAAVFTQKKGLHQMIDWSESNGFYWDIMAWHKPLATPLCKGHAPLDTEWCVCIREPGSYLPSTYKEYGESWYVEESYRRKTDFEHPTIKPLALMKRLIVRSCPKNGTVLDPFAGTGTTLKAANATGRNAIGYEINPKWAHYLERITINNLSSYETEVDA
jgi:DNA modification methylase